MQQPTTKNSKPRVVAWFGNHCDESKTTLLFADGKVLEGMGPYQKEVPEPTPTTLGALREERDDESVGLGLPGSLKAWAYGGDEGEFEFVVVELA